LVFVRVPLRILLVACLVAAFLVFLFFPTDMVRRKAELLLEDLRFALVADIFFLLDTLLDGFDIFLAVAFFFITKFFAPPP
jgi:hypothetical protein